MLDELLPLAKELAPDSAVWAAVLVWLVRVIRRELGEQRISRALTSTVGKRVGDVEQDLTRLEDALAAQGLFVPGVSRPAAVDRGRHDADDDPATEQAPRVPVPPIPAYPQHTRSPA